MIEIISCRIPIEKNIAEKLEKQVTNSIIYTLTSKNKTGFLNRYEPEESLKYFLNILNVINYLKIDSFEITSKFEKNDLVKIFRTESVNLGKHEIDELLNVFGDKLVGIIIRTNNNYLENFRLIKIYNQSEDSILESIKSVFDEDDIINDDNKFVFEGIEGLENILSPKKIKALKDGLYETFVTKHNHKEYFSKCWGITYRINITSGITKKDLIGNDDINGDKILDILREDKNGTLYYDGEIDNNKDFTGIDFEPENHNDSDLKIEIKEHVLDWGWDDEPLLQNFLKNNDFEVEILEKIFGGNKEDLRE
ncbi:MAG: Uncharacterised protein [Bacteroidetes bacterium MED-G17]|nr:MAG: Uncharacterised protein [Bacteroidetes bacterium MED-G17]